MFPQYTLLALIPYHCNMNDNYIGWVEAELQDHGIKRLGGAVEYFLFLWWQWTNNFWS